ncbi:hypothetical protein ACSNOH_13065 [Streptomyces sp. URMC 127]|uniref:hypothetical protein n=1 Tax=Streptomyces sp. URMC 127 TaxID=3423402 RepID=UPI003F1A435B
MAPSAAQPTAPAFTDRFLPAYHQAAHTRRIAAITFALDRVREESQTWEAIKAPGRCSDGSPLIAGVLPGAEEAFASLSWFVLRAVLHHALAVPERCRPAEAAVPRGTVALGHLADALARGEEVLANWGSGHKDLRTSPRALPAGSYAYGKNKTERDALMQPVIETWLADGDAFLRQTRHHARLSPARNPATVVPSLRRLLRRQRPALRPPGSAPARC